MLIDCNFTDNIKKMRDFFITKWNFFVIEEQEVVETNQIEYELHLINRELNVYIDIIKYNNDNEIDFTIKGNSKYFNEFALYIEYFLNKQKLVDANMQDFIQKADKEVFNCNIN